MAKRWTAEETVTASTMRREGRAYASIAAALGRTVLSVQGRLAYLDFTDEQMAERARQARERRAGDGARSRGSKSKRLQDWERQAIADAYGAGEKLEPLAVEFGITPGGVSRIGKAFGHPRRTHRGPLSGANQ